MSKLQDLIDSLCPNGVEFKPLGEIAEISTGSSDKKDAYNNGKYPFFVRSKIVERHNFFEYNEEAVIIPGEGGIGEIFHYINGPYALHQRVYRIHFTSIHVNTRFAYYYLFAHFKGFIMKKAVSATVTSIRKPMIETFPLAIPPLPVQEEIVRILDRFSNYAAELQAELQARKEQYEYYRNLLLTFNPSACGCGTDDKQKDNVIAPPSTTYKIQWKKMGEIGTFIRGNGLQKKDFTESGVGCIHYGQIYTHYGTSATKTKSFVDAALAKNLLKVEKGDIVLACTSENIEDVAKAVAWLGEETIVTGGHSVVFKHNEVPKYIAYFMQTSSFFNQKKKYAYGAKVIDIKTEDLAKILIPIPPIEVQEKIVAILDRFETLVNDISKGLPAEIEAQKTRYEYYRNKLLTFKPLPA